MVEMQNLNDNPANCSPKQRRSLADDACGVYTHRHIRRHLLMACTEDDPHTRKYAPGDWSGVWENSEKEKDGGSRADMFDLRVELESWGAA